MNEQKLKAFIRELCEPVTDSVTDMIYSFYVKVMPNMPKGLSEEQQLNLLKPMLDAQVQSIVASIKAIDTNKIAQEMQNGRES